MWKLLLATVAASAFASSAEAGVVTFNDAASFAAATSNDTQYVITGPTANFNGIYTQGPATFTSTTVNRFDDGSYGAGVSYLGLYPSQAFVTLSSGVSAIGFTLGTYSGADTLSVSVNAVPAATVTSTAGAPATMFLGFTDTDPITSVTFTDTATSREIDVLNFTTASIASGNPIDVPEPASLLLLGAATLATAARRRRPR